MAGKKKGEAGKGRPGSGSKSGMRNAKKRTKCKRELDKCMMLELMVRGYSQSGIARKMGLHQTQISHDWRQVLKELNETRVLDRDYLVTLKLEQYSHIITEALEAWESSKVATSRGKNGKLTKRRVKPDPRFLSAAADAYKALRELQGLDPAKKIDQTNRNLDWDAVLGDTSPQAAIYRPRKYSAEEAIAEALKEPGRQLGNGVEEVGSRDGSN